MTSFRILALGAASAALVAGCDRPEAATGTSNPPVQAVAASDQSQPASANAVDSFASETKTFRNWTVVCDNINTCTAYGPAEENVGYLIISMAAGPSARPEVSMGNCCLGEAGEVLRFSIDGGKILGKQKHGVMFGSHMGVTPASDQLISEIANGRFLTMEAGEQTVHKIDVPLTGAAAALLWIDERQGRLGTTTALIRKGDKPASAVPEAAPPPRVVAAPRVPQTQLPEAMPRSLSSLAAVRECASENAQDISRDEIYDVHRLGPDTLLWSVPCGSGAYNFSRLWLTSANDGSQAKLVSFPTSGRPEQTLVNSGFDPESNSISAFNKARGAGDCGSMASWMWTGSAFALTSEYIMGDCLGMPWEFWPSTWRATVQD